MLDNDSYVVDTWTSLTDINAPARSANRGFFLSGNAYSVAGFGAAAVMRDTDEYSVGGDAWSAKSDMPTPGRTSPVTAEIDGKGYAFGGASNLGAALADNDEYTVAGDAWASRTDIPVAIRRASGCDATNGAGYVFGGITTIESDRVEEYTPDIWATKTALPFARDLTASAAK